MSSQDQSRCTLGAGAVVLANGSIPLVKVGYGLAKGQWILPGGFLHLREHPATAAVRETFEETGLRVKVTGQACVRHRIRKDGSSDVYWVFLAELVHPLQDGSLPELIWPAGEIQEARFWTPKAITESTDVRLYTKLLIERVMQNWQGAHALLPIAQRHENDDQAFGIGPISQAR